MFKLVAAVVGLIAVAVAALVIFIDSDSPEAGDFYAVPSPLPEGPPGTVIRAEPMEEPPAGSHAWRILYLSETYTGSPTALSGLLVVPESEPPPGGRNVVAVPHGTTGVDSKCAVSNLGPEFWPAIDGLAEFIRAGDAVVVPDYEGLGTPGPHPYLVGDSEATATLDAVRAAHSFEPAAAGTRFVAWGVSQGGHAALFSAQNAADYAPELQLAGVAAAAPPSDLVALFRANRNGTLGRVLSAYTLDAWSQVYPELEINEIVTRQARPIVEQIAEICILSEDAPVAVALANQALTTRDLRTPPWESEPWKRRLEENTPGEERIPAPVLVTQGQVDSLVRPPITESFVKRLCRRGETVEYRTYPGVDHLYAGIATARDVAAWIADRFAGNPAPSNCPR